MGPFSDVAAERAVLAGICRFSADAYFDVADLLKPQTFTVEENAAIYKCIAHTLEKTPDAVIDIPTLHVSANELGLGYFFDKKDNAKFVQALFNLPIDISNIRRFAGKISKLSVAKLMHSQLALAQDKMIEITGDETLTHILGIAEDAIFNFSSLMSNESDEPKLLGTGLVDYVTKLGLNPVTQLGIPTGFKWYDTAIGGGLRDGTVNVIAARPKTGKTLLSDNMGFYIANDQKIPVLNLDTEMRLEDHVHRTLAMMTECYIHDVETGQYYAKPDNQKKIIEAARKLEEEKTPYYHVSIAGKPFEDQVAIMRRWLVKKVGLNDDGTAKPCVIIYDYLKLMDTQGMSQDLKEYQLLGFMMTSLHNFAMRYQVPILAFMQLNRDGITKETTDTASGSDRILWLCSNFTIFKAKSDDEIAEDGKAAGNRKLVPLAARHGAGLDNNDYINCHLKGWCAKIEEGKTKSELDADKTDESEGFVVNENDGESEDIPFDDGSE